MSACPKLSIKGEDEIFCFHPYSTLLIPVRRRGICSLVNGATLSELMSELRSDAFPATTIDFPGIRTRDSPRANRVF